ncbi:MAG: hypothetical protein COT84_05675 [Chlamydiae bacterium CG10_big_fil_rev_8_21_14_0_10_35_9]|nr:MAG: hypothetical protein COT84_05675 [Chlamydiae bacterium CG10_big_fil_rev_8_21_14_0_10_35_9]
MLTTYPAALADIESQQPVQHDDECDCERLERAAKRSLYMIGILTVTFVTSSISTMALIISTEEDCVDKSGKIALWSAMSTSIITGISLGGFCCSRAWKGIKLIKRHMDS